ncbi:MAG: hypothetical protein ACLSHO_06435 [Dysosmobacter sp.]
MMPAMGNLTHINYAITCCIGGLLAITGGLGSAPWSPFCSIPGR